MTTCLYHVTTEKRTLECVLSGGHEGKHVLREKEIADADVVMEQGRGT